MFYILPVNSFLDSKTVPKVSCNILLDLKIDPKKTYLLQGRSHFPLTERKIENKKNVEFIYVVLSFIFLLTKKVLYKFYTSRLVLRIVTMIF